MKNKTISLALMLAVVMSLLCVSVSAVPPVDGIVAKNSTTGASYEYLEDALDDAVSGQTVVLVGDYALEDNTAVKTGVTLVIPSSSALNDTTTGNNVSSTALAGEPYVTLTVPDTLSLTVNGTLLVAGNQQGSTYNTGCLTGDYGKINVAGSLVVNGTLYARGKITGTGSGTVTANSGSTVYQLFQIHDWRGGNGSLNAYNANIFPFNLYELTSIEAETVYNSGSSLIGQYYIYAGSTGNVGNVTVIGNNGQFEFSASSIQSGNITFKYDSTTNETNVTINGSVKTGDLIVKIYVTVWGMTVEYTVNSANTVCPFGYNMNVVIPSGASLNITNNLKFLPGCTVTVEAGGALTVANGKTAYFYTVGEGGYDGSYNYLGWNAVDNAALTREGSGTVTGTIASTSSTQGNIPYAGAATPVTIDEATQSGTAITAVPVTFYAYTLPATE